MDGIIQKITNAIMKWGDFDQLNYNDIKFAVYIILWDIVTVMVGCVGVFVVIGNHCDYILLVVFSIVFLTLRTRAGGIHATNRGHCIFITTVIWIVAMYYTMQISLSIYINYLSIFVSLVVIQIGPMEQQIKKLSLLQLNRNVKELRKYLLFWEMYSTIIRMVNEQISNAIQIAIIDIALLQIAYWLFNTLQYGKNSKTHKCVHQYLANSVIMLVCYVCTSNTQLVCNRFVYQEEIPPDIQRKFDNM